MHRRLPTAGIEVAPHYHQLLVLIAAVCNEVLYREPKVQAFDSTFISYRTINNYSIGFVLCVSLESCHLDIGFGGWSLGEECCVRNASRRQGNRCRTTNGQAPRQYRWRQTCWVEAAAACCCYVGGGSVSPTNEHTSNKEWKRQEAKSQIARTSVTWSSIVSSFRCLRPICTWYKAPRRVQDVASVLFALPFCLPQA